MKRIFLKGFPIAAICFAATLFACNPKSDKGTETTTNADSSKYSTTIDGKGVKLFALKNTHQVGHNPPF